MLDDCIALAEKIYIGFVRDAVRDGIDELDCQRLHVLSMVAARDFIELAEAKRRE